MDMHSEHLAACAGAMDDSVPDDSVPHMSAETFPRKSGGVRSALEEIHQDQ